MKLGASHLLGRPNWRRPGPGLCSRFGGEVESTGRALLHCLARKFASGSFPETMDLKSAWYDTTTTEMRTVTADPP